jgi:hypothetical protein
MERDAARFGHGPTQIETQYPSFYDAEDGEDEQCIADDEVEFVAESPIAELVVDGSQELGDFVRSSSGADGHTSAAVLEPAQRGPVQPGVLDEASEQSTELPGVPEARLADIKDSMEENQPSTELPSDFGQILPEAATANEEAQQPMSSPMQARPSQVSTVMPTQWTADRRNSAQQLDEDEEAPYSPQKSGVWEGNTLSSSPFPLPPWTFSNPDDDMHVAGGSRRVEPQFDSLVDFSLPPPPPMSSSMRQSSSHGLD